MAHFCFNVLNRWLLRARPRNDSEKLGSNKAGHFVPTRLLTRDSVCWSAGAGEDISFDLELIERFGCDVYAVDPTPRSVQAVREIAGDEPRYHFLPVGLWYEDSVMRFYAPASGRDVSHSVLNLQRTDDFLEVPFRPLDALVAEAGHDRVDLLKLDIEGAEYAVLEHLLRLQLLPRILVVEFHHFEPERKQVRRMPHSAANQWSHIQGWLTVRKSIRTLQNAGYVLFAVDGWDFSLVHEARSAPPAR
jgi:FkbM family methyltransferase